MIIFIILNLLLGYSAQAEYHQYIIDFSDTLIVLGFLLVAVSVVLYSVNNIPKRYLYDIFASGSLFIWFPYWYPDFREGSPVFIYFPLYFASVTAITMFFFIINRNKVEEDTLLLLQWLSESGRFHPILISLLVLAGLFFKQQFLLYPVAITLFATRYTLAETLEE